jgi:catechol 2,3-dioxygenase-like lactoylglutathione lyase family enzyme
LAGINLVALEVGDVEEALALYGRHFGLVVDDKNATRRALDSAGVAIRPGRGLDFLDSCGNYIQVVQYGEVQFTKAERSLSRCARSPPRSLPARPHPRSVDEQVYSGHGGFDTRRRAGAGRPDLREHVVGRRW